MRQSLSKHWLRLFNFAAQSAHKALQPADCSNYKAQYQLSRLRLFQLRRRLTCSVISIAFLWAAYSLFKYAERFDSLLSVNRWERAVIALDHANKPVGCVSWRATQQCSPYGLRMPSADTDCRSMVQFTSGYCECDNSAAVALVGCGMHSFTCFDRCRELGTHGMHFPSLMTCSDQTHRSLESLAAANSSSTSPRITPASTSSSSSSNGTAPASPSPALPGAAASPPSTAAGLAQHAANSSTGAASSPASSPAGLDAAAPQESSIALWEALLGPVRAHDPKPPALLRQRTEDDDWLREGERLPPGLAEGLRDSLAAYVAALGRPDVPGGALPPASQRGRGIVMVSGGLRYMVSAWLGVALLRRSGCSLPVEMWFPVLEYPTAAVVRALAGRGVACRAFAVPDLEQAGYSLKVAAIALSAFSEVLFLDADNFVLRDPAPLFEAPEYLASGAVFWRDYWAPSAVPELAAILGVPRRDLPDSTFEAGQMLLDKRKHWRGLRVALYFNYYRDVFYNLLTDYMGWGDKETFYYALLAAREAAYYVPVPTGSVGLVRPFCRRFKSRQLCREVFTGNSMLQFWADGRPLFLHANLDKWTLALPDSFADYTRRWGEVQPGGEAFLQWSQREVGLDLERFAYEQARAFRCAPFFPEYYEVRLRLGEAPIPPLGGLHPLMPGIEFHQLYRLGHRGTYTALFERSALDDFLFGLGVASRTAGAQIKRALRRVWGGARAARLLTRLERRLRNTLLSYSM